MGFENHTKITAFNEADNLREDLKIEGKLKQLAILKKMFDKDLRKVWYIMDLAIITMYLKLA